MKLEEFYRAIDTVTRLNCQWGPSGAGARIAYTRSMSEHLCFPEKKTKSPSGTDTLSFNHADPHGIWSVQIFLPGPDDFCWDPALVGPPWWRGRLRDASAAHDAILCVMSACSLSVPPSMGRICLPKRQRAIMKSRWCNCLEFSLFAVSSLPLMFPYFYNLMSLCGCLLFANHTKYLNTALRHYTLLYRYTIFH